MILDIVISDMDEWNHARFNRCVTPQHVAEAANYIERRRSLFTTQQEKDTFEATVEEWSRERLAPGYREEFSTMWYAVKDALKEHGEFLGIPVDRQLPAHQAIIQPAAESAKKFHLLVERLAEQKIDYTPLPDATIDTTLAATFTNGRQFAEWKRNYSLQLSDIVIALGKEEYPEEMAALKKVIHALAYARFSLDLHMYADIGAVQGPRA